MNNFSISDIENLTGIKAHTIRAWERRYGILQSDRSEGHHRQYDGDSLKHLLRVSWLHRYGLKISRIAIMEEEEIKEMALNLTEGDTRSEIFLNRLLEAAIDLDMTAVSDELDLVIKRLGFENALELVLFPFLQKLGLFWLTGHIIPSQEHAASSMVIRKIIVETEKIPLANYFGERYVLLFTPSGETHEIPILYMRYLMRKIGIKHLFAGTNVEMTEIESICNRQPIKELYFHLITNLTQFSTHHYLNQLSKKFPQLKIYYSGTAINQISLTPANVQVLGSVEEMKEFARRFDLQ